MEGAQIEMIEFLQNRIYLGAFDYTPDDDDRFVYVPVDDSLTYNAFHHDFGPLSAGHLYRFAIMLHEEIGDRKNAGRAIVFYSGTDPRLRANTACVLCCYMVLIQKWPPHLALAPIAQANPPFMPFRDAGYSTADFELLIQDVVYGVWRAKEHKILSLSDDFDIDGYHHYEQVENGDLNNVGLNFVAFASPRQHSVNDKVDSCFSQVLDYFTDNNVKVVVRLNSHLYPAATFLKNGIKHIDLIFEDGSCPTMAYVHAFIGIVEGVIKDDESAKVAVHCRAGLGRTGCLIGAYLIYRYGFTAQEVIGYMRFMRPGMVVGPQQHWLYINQNQFREWRYTMAVSARAEPDLSGYSRLVSKDQVSGGAPRTPERKVLTSVHNSQTLPVPTPGQPRKSPTQQLNVRKVRNVSASAHENTPSTSAISGSTHGTRVVTDFNSSQQREIARGIRTASNPSPRRVSKRMQTPTSHPIPAGTGK